MRGSVTRGGCAGGWPAAVSAAGGPGRRPAVASRMSFHLLRHAASPDFTQLRYESRFMSKVFYESFIGSLLPHASNSMPVEYW